MLLNQQSDGLSDEWPIFLLHRIPGLRRSFKLDETIFLHCPIFVIITNWIFLKAMYESLLMQSLRLNHRNMNIVTEF